MSSARVWRRLLGVEHTAVESVDLVDDGAEEVLVASVRPTRSRRSRCSRCGRPCRGYDRGDGRRRWRALDVGSVKTFLEADAPRVSCPDHGVVVAAVPWARPGARCTTGFEDTCVWLAAHAAGSTVAELMRVTWRTVAGVVTRVVADLAGKTDRLDGLRRIGIDEIAYRKGHRYLLAVTDHDTGRLVWAAPGRNQETLRAFFVALGTKRAKALTHVSADGAEWIHDVVGERAPRATLCLDPFHTVAWATGALDTLRRRLAADLRAAGRDGQAGTLKHTRWALLKNPEDLGPDQRATLARLARDNRQLYRGYLMKEQLREIFKPGTENAHALLGGLIAWAARSRIPEFVKLAATLRKYRELIANALDHRVSNARSEATNVHLRLLTRRAYGYQSPGALIAMAMLTRGGLCPALPGRDQ